MSQLTDEIAEFRHSLRHQAGWYKVTYDDLHRLLDIIDKVARATETYGKTTTAQELDYPPL